MEENAFGIAEDLMTLLWVFIANNPHDPWKCHQHRINCSKGFNNMKIQTSNFFRFWAQIIVWPSPQIQNLLLYILRNQNHWGIFFFTRYQLHFKYFHILCRNLKIAIGSSFEDIAVCGSHLWSVLEHMAWVEQKLC